TKLSCPLENGHRMLPVKTLCDILDVQYKEQDSWLKEHPFFSQLYRLAGVVAADGKVRDMNCLSVFDVQGWVCSISLNNRKPGSVEKQTAFLLWLRERTLEMYKSVDLFMQENKYELELTQLKVDTEAQIAEATQTVKKLKQSLKQIETQIEEIRVNRFTGQTALPFPEK
ncbi:MAG: phage antirepressor N-terminal domain-containing protein, partial [Saprospiraceae bacterium]